MDELVRFLREGELRAAATRFLEEHGALVSVPVPIEEIVEFRLGLDIVPVPNLLSGPRGINGYLSADCTTIYVDDGLFRNVETRYLFTLAHEVGHLVLHRDLYRGIDSDEAWREFHRRLAQHDLSGAEYQANTFAGLVLAPERTLREATKGTFDELVAEIRRRGADIDLAGDAFWSYVADGVARGSESPRKPPASGLSTTASGGSRYSRSPRTPVIAPLGSPRRQRSGRRHL